MVGSLHANHPDRRSAHALAVERPPDRNALFRLPFSGVITLMVTKLGGRFAVRLAVSRCGGGRAPQNGQLPRQDWRQATIRVTTDRMTSRWTLSIIAVP